MKKILILMLFNLGLSSFAQTPRFTKYNVADTEMQIYLPTEPKWDQSTTGDGSKVYVYNENFGSINYSAIIIKISDTVDNKKPESLLENYLTFSEESAFFITQRAGFGRGHTLENQPKVIGILDIGKSKEGKEYKILGWTDGKYIAILATSSLEDMNYNIQEMFLRGIRFPK